MTTHNKVPIVLVGDSIAEGFRLAKPYGIVPNKDYSKSGKNPAQILNDIRTYSGAAGSVRDGTKRDSSFKGAIVILSTGWSNDPKGAKTPDNIREQLKVLLTQDPIAIYVLGVATNYKPSGGTKVYDVAREGDPNNKIKSYINDVASPKIPIRFVGGFEAKNEGNYTVHANTSYYTTNPVLAQIGSTAVTDKAPETKQEQAAAKAEVEVSIGTNLANIHNLSIAQKLERAKEIIPFLKRRREIIEMKNQKEGEEYLISNDVDNALKGIAIQIDTAKSLGFPSLGGVGVTKEDEALYAKINDNYINSYLGYSYPDLSLEAVITGTKERRKLSTEDMRRLQKVEPTFFIDAKPVVSRKDLNDLALATDQVALTAFKEAANRGFWDSALGVGIDTNAVNEALDEHGFNALVTQALEETAYLPVEDEITEKQAIAGQTGSSGGDLSLATGAQHDGTNSTYTGEFPAGIPSSMGKLSASKGASIGVGYPPTIRALMDFIARAEGTHPAVGAGKGYRDYVNHARLLDLNAIHPNVTYKAGSKESSAAGIFQILSGTWRGANGGKNAVMSVANQDKAFVYLLKSRKVYDYALKGDWASMFAVPGPGSAWKDKSNIAIEWASLPAYPTGDTGAHGGQKHSGLTRAKAIEALKHLQKFYEGASPGERAPIPSVIAPSTGNNTADAMIVASSPRSLNTETQSLTHKIDHVVESNFFRRLTGTSGSHADKQYSQVTLSIVQVLSPNTFLMRSNSTTPTYTIVRITGVRTPSMPLKLQILENTNQGYGRYYDHDVRDNEGAELFAPEAYNTLKAWLKPDIQFKLPESSGTVTARVITVSDLMMVHAKQPSLASHMVKLGLALPKDNTSFQAELKQAKDNNKGVWAYQATAIETVNGTSWRDRLANIGSARFVKMTKIDGSVATAVKNVVGLTPNKAQVVTHEQQTQKVVSNEKPGTTVTLADNAYTANSKPVKASTYAWSQAHAKSKQKCALYVRKALQAAGYKFTPQPSAYQYHPNGTLITAGFAQIPISSTLMPGDVIVLANTPAHPHGHIAIFHTNGKWVSDFKQNNAQIYRSGHNNKAALYRDKEFLAATGVQALSSSVWEDMKNLGKGGVAVTSYSIPGDTPNEQYVAEAKQMGVYADLSNYTIEQVEGHKYQPVSVDDSFSVFGTDAKRENHIKKIVHNYERGLNICFPVLKAYAVLGNEDDDMYVEGVPLNPPAYYELPPLQSFNLECNNDFNPLDVCVFSCINPSAMRSALDDMSNLAFSSVPELIGTQWFNPVIANRLNLVAGMKIHVKAGYSNDPNKLVTIFNGVIKETSGNRDFLIQCVCESYALELISQQLGAAEPTNFAGDHNASTGLLFGYSMLADNISHFGARLDSKWHLSGHIIGSVVKPLAAVVAGLVAKKIFLASAAIRSVTIFASIMTYFTGVVKETDVNTDVEGGLNAEGISYMNTVSGQDGKGFFRSVFGDNIFAGKGRLGDFRDPENKAMVAPISAGGYLWNIFNLSRANLTQRVYMNIYAASIEKIHGEYRDTMWSRYTAIVSFNRKFKYRFYVIRSTIWVVMKEMEYRHPGTLTKPLWYEDRQTLFYGTKEQCYIARDLDPMFMNRAGQHSRYNDVGKPYAQFYLNERKKRFDVATGFHYLSTKTNVISSNIKLSRGFATKVNAVFYESKWYGGIEGYNEKSDTILLDKTLAKHEIREKTISLGGTNGSYMAWMYGTQELKKEMESMYDGHIIVTGDPTIRAGDYAYISDTNRGIYGTIKIRECSHHFSVETGYTTIIKPGLMVEATHFMWDDYFVRLNLACAMLDQKIKVQQDISLQGGIDVESYLNVIKLIGNNKKLGFTDYLYNFIGYALVAGVTWASVRSIIYTARNWGVTRAAMASAASFTRAYAVTGGKALGSWVAGVAKSYHARVSAANARVLAQVAAANGGALRGTVSNVTRMGGVVRNFAGQAWARTIGVRSLGSNIFRLAWSMISWVGAKMLAHPLVALVAGVVGILMSWALSAVRRMKLLHNAITYFPLYYNGKAYQAGVLGWSGKGQWDAMFENLRKNAKSLNRAARMLENSTTSLDVEGSLKTRSLVGVMNFLAGAAALPNSLAGNATGLESDPERIREANQEIEELGSPPDEE